MRPLITGALRDLRGGLKLPNPPGERRSALSNGGAARLEPRWVRTLRTRCTCPTIFGSGAGFERLSVEGRPQEEMRDMNQNPSRAYIFYV